MSKILRVVIADDEPLAVERLTILIGRGDGVELVGTASDGDAAVRCVRELEPDVCFLDIAMPGTDGMDAARRMTADGRSPCIVFVTAFDRFAVAAFDVNAVDYIVKPVAPERLQRSLARVREHVRVTGTGKPPSRYLEEFWASDLQGMVRVSVEQVDRIVAERDYMRLHSGKRSWLINDSLARLERDLDPSVFVRLHRSAIVRRSFVAALRHDEHGWLAVLMDGEVQRVGRSYAANVRRMLGRATSLI